MAMLKQNIQAFHLNCVTPQETKTNNNEPKKKKKNNKFKTSETPFDLF
jgi:hypothetical protein